MVTLVDYSTICGAYTRSCWSDLRSQSGSGMVDCIQRLTGAGCSNSWTPSYLDFLRE
jgi:hypothetical protein